MQFGAIIISALSIVGGCHAWASDGHGTWVANNVVHNIQGIPTHEACTRMGNNKIRLQNDEPCGYWTNAQGNIYNGHCKQQIAGGKLVGVTCW